MSGIRMKNDLRRNYGTKFSLYPISLTGCIIPSMPQEIESESVIHTKSNQGQFNSKQSLYDDIPRSDPHE